MPPSQALEQKWDNRLTYFQKNCKTLRRFHLSELKLYCQIVEKELEDDIYQTRLLLEDRGRLGFRKRIHHKLIKFGNRAAKQLDVLLESTTSSLSSSPIYGEIEGDMKLIRRTLVNEARSQEKEKHSSCWSQISQLMHQKEVSLIQKYMGGRDENWTRIWKQNVPPMRLPMEEELVSAMEQKYPIFLAQKRQWRRQLSAIQREILIRSKTRTK